MSRTDVARRYAQALIELADERGSHAAMASSVAKLRALLDATPEATVFLANRSVAVAERRKVLESVLSGLEVEPMLANLVRLLLDRGRIDDLGAIAARLNELLDAKSGVVKAEVVSAEPLDDASITRLRATLLGADVELSASVDKDLIGGLRVQVGQLVFDASVRNHLDKLRERLAASHVA
jgi:F-type H+-transporting ATPase subunit delta